MTTPAAAAVAEYPSFAERLQAMRDVLYAIGLHEQSQGVVMTVEDTYAFLYVNHMLDAYVRSGCLITYPRL